MASAAVTTKEMTFAYYFLKRLGANMNNPYLITAVVAWLRAEVGYNLKFMHNMNNPLNIRHSPFANGYRHAGHNGVFATFATLQKGAYAAADLLKSAGHDYRGYWLIIAAAVHDSKGVKDQQAQARDFLEAIALSKWDSGHYSLPKNQQTLATYQESNNRLFKVWLTITGNLPVIKVMPDHPAKRSLPKPRPPRSLNPPSATSNYIDPFEAQGFYKASRPSSDLGNLPSF